MADNLALDTTPPAGSKLATRNGTYSGTTGCNVQAITLTDATGADNAKVFTDVPIAATLGAVTETAPASDTASSGLNGRLQRLAQRITSLIGLFPTALTASGNFKVAMVEDTSGSLVETDDGSVAGGQANFAAVISVGYTWNGAAWVRGGWTPSVTISAASTNATSVKGSAGVVGSIAVSNVNAAARYFKLYNKASTPTVGTDTPVATFLLPPNTAGPIPLPVGGLAFSLGIAWALTTGIAHTDTGAVAANEHAVNLGWL